MLGLARSRPTAPGLWVVLIGLGMGLFPLALVMISLRTSFSADTARLSAMAQGIGYLISTSGRFAFGVLRGVTGTWTVSVPVLVALPVLLTAFGRLAGGPRTV